MKFTRDRRRSSRRHSINDHGIVHTRVRPGREVLLVNASAEGVLIDAAHRLDLIECPEHAANGWMAGTIHRWPIVMRMHCPWELFVRINRFPFNPMNRVLAMLERRTARCYADAVTVPSHAMKNVVTPSLQYSTANAPRMTPL